LGSEETYPDKQIEALSNHPFTIIGLSDREKFHTGMLAHTLRTLFLTNEAAARELLKKLWGNSAADEGLEKPANIEIKVEHQSIDLVVLVDDKIVLFAEMKFKTTLSKGQLDKYQKKFPEAKGVLLGLFPERREFENKIPSLVFPSIVSSFFAQDANSEWLSGDEDEIILIRMWVKYLRHLSELTCWFTQQGCGAILDTAKFGEDLKKLKLRGIFERCRFDLIAKAVKKMGCGIQPEKSNTHGRALLTYRTDGGKGFPFGLQWQAGSLKLFVTDKSYEKNSPTKARDAFLHCLAIKFCDEFSQCKWKMNRQGKFRSVTVERWDVFDDIGEHSKGLLKRINFLEGR